MTPAIQSTVQECQAKIELLNQLIYVAQETKGSEVWRALFAEIRTSLVERVERHKQ